MATARSRFPLPRKSPATTECGLFPTVTVAASVKFPVPSPSRIDTVPSAELATARSRFPSPLKSPAAIEYGLFPTVSVAPAEKFPVPSPSRIDTVPLA